VFCVSTCSAQEVINQSNFKDKIAKDIVVVEFWAEWNKANEFTELNKLKDSSVYRVDIMHCAKLQADYKISAVPTVVVFDNGVEKERFNANIMFQLEADKKTIQTSIDTIILNKFQ
jgi:thioredoxin-like negative regulator of GroEL